MSQNPSNSSFKIIKELSKGRFGKVYLAVHQRTNRNFILKETRKIDPEIIGAIQNVTHSALATQAEIIRIDNKYYIARPFIEGISLKELIRMGRSKKQYTNEFWLKAFIYLAEALCELHMHNIIHRDIKPSNIIVPKLNNKHYHPDPLQIVIIDFEQALKMNTPVQAGRAPFALCYSPPEQLLNRNHLTGPWSDIFALALTLFEAIEGKPAFWYHDPEMLLHLQLNQPIKNISAPAPIFNIIAKATTRAPFRIPPRLMNYSEIDSCIKKGIEGRYQNCKELLKDLNLINL